MIWRLGRTAALYLILIALTSLSSAHGESTEVRLFLGVTHDLLENTDMRAADRQVRAFEMVQDLLLNIQRQLPPSIIRNSRVGDLPAWKWPDDRKQLQEQNFTHYLIAEPQPATADGPVLEIKWYVGNFSADKDRELNGWLKDREGAPRRVISIPELSSQKAARTARYDKPEFKENGSGNNGQVVWSRVEPTRLAEDITKILKHIFPEMRSQNVYFIACIEDMLRRDDLKEINIDFMFFLWESLQRNSALSPAITPFGREQAVAICSDRYLLYKRSPEYHFYDADFLISGWLGWGLGTKAHPRFFVDNRVTEMRRDYVALAGGGATSREQLDEFCAEPRALLDFPVMTKLAEYIHGHGFNADKAISPPGDWKCN
jgi:hypothetical protein